MASEKQTVKIGLVGLGWFGAQWARLIAQTDGIELTAVCSRTAERGREIADQYDGPVRPRSYPTSYVRSERPPGSFASCCRPRHCRDSCLLG